MELPKIISVDDHVVEPRHVWQTWLPKKFREKGPRVEQAKWAPFEHKPGAKYTNVMDDDGMAGDYWIFEDKVIYVHKRFVAIPLVATPGGDLAKFDRTVMEMTPVTYDEMRPGCYDRDARVEDMAANWVDGSLPFPTFPRFCGQTFMEADDHELGLACVRAYNDWMIEEWCEPSGGVNIPLGLIPLWDADLAAAEVERNAARGMHAICFSEIPPRLGLPSIHTDVLGSAVRGVQRERCHALHAHRLVVDHAGRLTRRARGRRRHARLQQRHGFAGRLAVLREVDLLPELEDRLLRRPDRLDPLRARTGRHGVGAARRVDAHQRTHPGAAEHATTGVVSSAASPPTGTGFRIWLRWVRTTSASRPTTPTPTPRGRTARSTPRRW